MATRVYNLNMESLQKLREFQFLLMKKKFGKASDKMEFISYVQLKCDNIRLEAIQLLAVVNGNIHIDQGTIIIQRSWIRDIQSEGTQVILKLKRPTLMGSVFTLSFSTEVKKTDFISALGPVQSDESSESEQEGLTPPTTDESN